MTNIHEYARMRQRALDENHLITRFLHASNRLFSRAYHKVEVLTPCPLPREGPAIVICNHISSLDPFLIQGTSQRVIRWMMAKEYFDLPVAHTLCGMLGFIPVNRSGRDSESLKAGLRALAAGEVLGIFPEGRISPTRELLPFQPGLGVIAQRTGATIYPAALEGIPRNLSMVSAAAIPQTAKIFYGPPMTNSDRNKTFSADFRQAVQALQCQALAKTC